MSGREASVAALDALMAFAEQTGGSASQWMADELSEVRGVGERLRARRVLVPAVAGGVCVPGVSSPVPRTPPPQTLVNLLKHPFCRAELQRVVLEALAVTYEREFEDVWAFVTFAEPEHPELDLLTPPTRPERR